MDPTDLSTGRSPGVPGWWAGFEAALAKHGSRPKAEVVQPATDCARNGFAIYPFLYGEMLAQLDTIGKTPTGRRIYMPNGALLPPGAILKQVEAADTRERLVAEGNQFFYHGAFAQAYCDAVKAAGGVITPKDFDRYEVRWMEPARGTYRGYDILASPPPDNGGTHVIEALNMLELLDLKKMGPPTESADSLYWMTRVINEAYEQGAKHTDPSSHDAPLEKILSKDYAAMRLRLMQMTPVREARPAAPPGSNHVTVVDGKGNIATILHSVMSLPWQTGLFAMGLSIAASGAHFFRVMPAPGDRATDCIAPNIIFKNGRPVLVSGSPSVGLLQNIVQNTMNILDIGIPIGESVLRPRFGGLSAFGREVIREMHRLRMLVDISHVSDDCIRDVLDLSDAPIIASHSSCKAISNHPRDLSDAMLRTIAAAGGVVGINFYSQFLDQAYNDELGRRSVDPLAMLNAPLPLDPDALDAYADERIRTFWSLRLPRPPFERILEQIDHAVQVAGIDHVGIGSDLDSGAVPTPVGLDSVSNYPRITEGLLRRGYAEADVAKVLGENFRRVYRAAVG